MSKKKQSHLRGERGQAFTDKIRGIPLEQLLCVSLDISKYFHVAMIHNGLGEIVTSTFEIDIFQSGFEQLGQAIDQAIEQTQAQVVLVGMEPTGHYFENLARHLHQRPRPVTLINSYAVKQNREQQRQRRESRRNLSESLCLLRVSLCNFFCNTLVNTTKKLKYPNLDEIRVSRSDPNVYLFYKSERVRRWVCAVIKRFDQEGFLITTYPTDAVKEGTKIWPK